MKIFKVLILVLIYMSSAQTSASELAKSDFTICEETLTQSVNMNANQLWQAAGSCQRIDNTYAMTFLLLAGQIRAMSDMTELKAVSDAEEIKVADLYGVLYYQTGGSGDVEIYRSAELTNKLIKELNDWVPEVNNSYQPGWEYMTVTDTQRYNQMIDCQRAVRIEKLKQYASLVRNDKYYNASKELDALRKKNPGPFTHGTETYDQISYLTEKMQKVKPSYQVANEDLKECEIFNAYVPDPDAEFTQLHVGANGTENSEVNIYTSHVEILNSWVAKSLSANELEKILEQVDFENQVLVSLSFGKRSNATGTILISEVDYNTEMESLSVTGLIGVNMPNCKESTATVYPFALAVAPKPEKPIGSLGYFAQNFGDGCKPVMQGKSTN